MARKRNPGFLDFLTRAHWSVGVISGVLAFALISKGAPALLLGASSEIARTAGKSLEPALFWLGLIALSACWLAALTSAFGAARRRSLLDKQTGIESIRNLSWQEFERLVAEAYHRQGYQVKEMGGEGKDGGIDLLLKRDGRTEMVQCKLWRNSRVSAPVAREMWGLVAHHGYHGVKIVCVGEFTEDAARFAQGKNMELVSGRRLVDLISRVQTACAHSLQDHAPAPDMRHPLCPKCKAKMVLRSARKTQEDFWGCPKYPGCTGTRSLK